VDISVIVAYMVSMIAVGAYFTRRAPLEDQKEIGPLVIRETKMFPVKPSSESKAPSEEGALISRLRTRPVQVHVSLHEIPSFPVT
jgi:hypothetical protein